MNKSMLVIGTVVVAASVFLLGANYYRQARQSEQSALSRDNADVLVRPHSPVFGSESAKVTIVEFLDPACETCRAFGPLVKNMVTASFGQVRLVVRYAAFHQGSDQVVRALAAAHMQGKFWPVLNAVFDAQPTWAAHDNPRPELIWTLLDGTGLDVAKARADAQSDAVTAVLRQDMADIAVLKVTKTPGFFVNGKPLVEFGADQLKDLVRNEMRLANGG